MAKRKATKRRETSTLRRFLKKHSPKARKALEALAKAIALEAVKLGVKALWE